MEPHVCPECQKVFGWGRDADSAMVERQGEQWLSCAENAHWKLAFHMAEQHPTAGFLCPRRAETVMTMVSRDGRDWWDQRDGHKACSYCGSLSPEEFFAAVKAGHAVVPTDKNYKAYVDLPNPQVGQTIEIGSESGPAFRDGKQTRDDLTDEEKRTGKYRRVIMGKASATISAKFYFQHLSDQERDRFIELLNAKKMKLAMPGHFYVTPFFAKRRSE